MAINLDHEKLKKYIVKKSREHIFSYLYSQYRKKYGAKLAEKLEVVVCPYCNRNFINSKGEKTPVQFDHFFNKSHYPIFALSLYNLIPCCGTCNNWKETTDFDISLYDKNYETDKIVQFSYFPIKYDDYKIDIKALDEKMKINIEKLQLNELYSSHIDLLRELILKKRMYNKHNIDFLQRIEEENGMPNSMTIKEVFYGNYLKQDKYYLRPLSKFTHDIITELNDYD